MEVALRALDAGDHDAVKGGDAAARAVLDKVRAAWAAAGLYEAPRVFFEASVDATARENLTRYAEALGAAYAEANQSGMAAELRAEAAPAPGPRKKRR